jgi:hypothetical protein
MNELESIDEEMKILYERLKKQIQTLEFEVQYEVKLQKDMDLSFLKNLKFQGVYLFEISTQRWKTLNDFISRWEDEKYIKHWTPNPKKTRVQYHKELIEWMPIYLGKSRNVGKRVTEHFNLNLHKPTTAMKLLARENLYGEMLRISSIRLDIFNYDWVVPIVETELRDKINPILGRQ